MADDVSRNLNMMQGGIDQQLTLMREKGRPALDFVFELCTGGTGDPPPASEVLARAREQFDPEGFDRMVVCALMLISAMLDRDELDTLAGQ